jgi:aminoglycoside phosphotransferase family enzyme
MKSVELMAPALSDIVGFLSLPSAYGLQVRAVEARETHMSWVFLTPDRVFKLKKPLKTPFLDYSTLTNRERFCREEVRLNRRLAPSVYLGVTTVTQAHDGALALNGSGRVVEWLVEMRRLPEAWMLDHAIKNGAATLQSIDRALGLLFAFFLDAAPVELQKDRYLRTLQMQHEENRAVLSDPKFDLARSEASDIIGAVEEAISAAPDWLFEPLQSWRIIEGHGDLRPEHICLMEPPAIIDCLEFNRDLRLVDPFDELSYLALECRLLDAHDLAGSLIGRYAAISGARPPRRLLDFYTVYRAAIRARLALGHIADRPQRDARKWADQARAYLAAARPEALRLRRPEAQ